MSLMHGFDCVRNNVFLYKNGLAFYFSRPFTNLEFVCLDVTREVRDNAQGSRQGHSAETDPEVT